MVELCPLQKLLKSQPPAPGNVILSGDRVLAGGQVRMRSVGRASCDISGILIKGNLDPEFPRIVGTGEHYSTGQGMPQEKGTDRADTLISAF